jgi:hypothetical protein
MVKKTPKAPNRYRSVLSLLCLFVAISTRGGCKPPARSGLRAGLFFSLAAV